MPEKLPDSRTPEKLPDARTLGKLPDTRMPEKLPDAQIPEKPPDAQTPGKPPDAQTPGKPHDARMPEKLPDARTPGKLPDPRVIFALALVLSGYGVAVRDVRLMAAMLLLGMAGALCLGVGLRKLFGSFRFLWQAAVAIALMQSIFAPSGTVLISIGAGPALTVGGLLKGLLVLLRLALFITGGAMFTAYPQRALIQGMVQARLPYEAAYMISIGLRFIPRMREELKDSLTALQLRGVVIEELRLRKRLSLYSYLLLPAVAASIQNARELAMSMEMRAFRAKRGRTSYYTLTLSRSDVVLLCGVLLLAALLAAAMVFIYNSEF